MDLVGHGLSPLTQMRTVEVRITLGVGEGYVLKSNVKNLFPSGYKPELDVTDELGEKLASRYLQLIGILR
jgi:hypothetical protein